MAGVEALPDVIVISRAEIIFGSGGAFPASSRKYIMPLSYEQAVNEVMSIDSAVFNDKWEVLLCFVDMTPYYRENVPLYKFVGSMLDIKYVIIRAFVDGDNSSMMS